MSLECVAWALSSLFCDVMVSISYYTDPVCPWSWGIEPSIRKLMVQFGDALSWTFVMGGVARDLSKVDMDEGGDSQQVYGRLIREWLIAAERTGMPLDPLLWVEGPIATSYPACMAMKAATEQASDGGYRYLRRLREALMCERRKLDHAEALVEEARAAGLDVERFRVDLRSHAITEAFGSDLERTQRLTGDWPADGLGEGTTRFSRGSGGAPLPSLVFRGQDEREQAVLGFQPYEAYRSAALAAGAKPPTMAAPSPEELLARFGTVATKEVELVCELPGPRAGAELFRLAEQWRVRPVWRMTGYLWEPA
jgi:predicted DsbA family dithiol-disulfide isomerase